MLKNIPTHLIAGPLGAGKTSVIKSLLAQKPPDERWAVLINEFGQIGLDAALLTTEAEGISLAEVAGGCLCCVNGLPFQVGLSRLLRKAQPDRLLIEPSGLGHPAELLRQLAAPPWQDVLTLQPSVMVLDATALAHGEPIAPSQLQALENSGLVLLNKCETLGQADRIRIAQQLAPHVVRWISHGQVPIDEFPGVQQRAVEYLGVVLPATSPAIAEIWLDPKLPIVKSQAHPEGWSIGWRWHPSQRFDTTAVADWLTTLQWRRAKLVLRGETAWLSGNAVEGGDLSFKPSEWRKDSRLELIFDQPQDEARLKSILSACRI